jgi:branched-chain amino acid transport system ATP-binding protein
VLALTGLEVAYGKAAAVHDVDIHVGRAEIVTVVGRNGAGKTSTMRGASGFTRSEAGRVVSGRVEYLGRDIVGRDPSYAARLGLRLVPERDKVFRTLTVAENLEVAVPKASMVDHDLVFDAFPELREKLRLEAGYLSGGQKQMLAIGMALQAMPPVFLLDELSLGLAPGVVVDLMNRISILREQYDMAFLIVEQNVAAVVPVSDRIYVLGNGTVAAEFTADLDATVIGRAMLAGDDA